MAGSCSTTSVIKKPRKTARNKTNFFKYFEFPNSNRYRGIIPISDASKNYVMLEIILIVLAVICFLIILLLYKDGGICSSKF